MKKEKKMSKKLKLKTAQISPDREEKAFDTFELRKESAPFSLTEQEADYVTRSLTFSGHAPKDLMAV